MSNKKIEQNYHKNLWIMRRNMFVQLVLQQRTRRRPHTSKKNYGLRYECVLRRNRFNS